MAKAEWMGTVIAESTHTQEVEGNLYFPMESIQCEYFSESPTTSDCIWKGTASYFTLEVDGKKNPDAAWYYPEPKPKAEKIRNHVAFWKGVTVSS